MPDENGTSLASSTRRSRARLGLGLAVALSSIAALASGPEPIAPFPRVAILAWLGAMGLAFAVALGGERIPWQRPERLESLGLCLLLLAAVELRLIGLEAIPASLSGDESAAGLWALAFVNGEANNVLGWGWFSFPALHVALQALPVAILGNTVAALRILSALVGSIGVLAVYGLGRLLFGRSTGALAAFFTALWHYHLAFSHLGLNNIFDPLFASLALMGLWLGWERGSRFGYALLGLSLGLGHYFYVSMRLMPLLVLIWCILLARREPDRARARAAGLRDAAGLALVAVLPLLGLALREPETYLAPFLRVSLAAEPVAYGYQGSRALFALGRLSHGVLGLVTEPLRSFYTPGAPLLLPMAALLFLMGALILILEHDRRGLMLLLPIATVIGSNMLSMEVPAAQRYILAAPAIAILVALPLGRILDDLGGRARLWRHLGGIAIAGLLLILAQGELRLFFGEVPGRWQIGGLTTRTANALARHVAQAETPGLSVYFFGSPRMGLPTEMQYFAPSARFTNVIEPLSSPPDWKITGPALFYFLPERVYDADWVLDAYASTDIQWIAPEGAQELGFWVYRVRGPD